MNAVAKTEIDMLGRRLMKNYNNLVAHYSLAIRIRALDNINFSLTESIADHQVNVAYSTQKKKIAGALLSQCFPLLELFCQVLINKPILDLKGKEYLYHTINFLRSIGIAVSADPEWIKENRQALTPQVLIALLKAPVIGTRVLNKKRKASRSPTPSPPSS